jgi:hypothetical protein
LFLALSSRIEFGADVVVAVNAVEDGVVEGNDAAVVVVVTAVVTFAVVATTGVTSDEDDVTFAVVTCFAVVVNTMEAVVEVDGTAVIVVVDRRVDTEVGEAVVDATGCPVEAVSMTCCILGGGGFKSLTRVTLTTCMAIFDVAFDAL